MDQPLYSDGLASGVNKEPEVVRVSMTKKQSELLKLSASSIKTYEQCARKYYFQYIEKVKIKKEWEHLHLGTFVHEVLEDFHNSLKQNPDQDWAGLMGHIFQECLLKFKEKPELDGSFKSKHPVNKESKIRAHGMLQTYLAMLRRDGLPQVVANEQKFSFEISPSLLIRGVIDRVDEDASGDSIIIDYKGLAVDTPIPTPTGWTTMADLHVGDQVLGSDGRPTVVTIKSDTHNRPCYKLTLSDGSEVVCDNVHLWNIGYRENGRRGNYDTTMSADELFLRFNQAKLNRRGGFFIQNPKALQLPEADLPIDPWLLGAWLGDGHSKTGSFTVGAQDLSDMQNLLSIHWRNTSLVKDARHEVYTITCRKPNPSSCGYSHGVDQKYTDAKTGQEFCRGCEYANNQFRLHGTPRSVRNNVPLATLLAKNNLIHNKHIPPIYLRASYNQRLQLLRGLMDTDGYFNSKTRRCTFVSARKDLADSVADLIRTFGLNAQVHRRVDRKSYISFRVEFRPVGIVPFLLARKAEKVKAEFTIGVARTDVFALRRKIISMEKVDSVPTQCISVDAVDSLYICGPNLTLSHNTGKSKYLDEFQLLVYGLFLREQNPQLERYKASYIVLGEGSKNIQYLFTRTDVDRVLEKIKKIATHIETDKTWEPKPSFLCKWCDFEDICPAMKLRKLGDTNWTQTSK